MVFFSSVLWGLCGGGFVRGFSKVVSVGFVCRPGLIRWFSLVVNCGVCVEEGSLGGFL